MPKKMEPKIERNFVKECVTPMAFVLGYIILFLILWVKVVGAQDLPQPGAPPPPQLTEQKVLAMLGGTQAQLQLAQEYNQQSLARIAELQKENADLSAK